MRNEIANSHDDHAVEHHFHLVKPSPWPIVGSLSLFITAIGAVLFLHHYTLGHIILPLGLMGVIYVMYSWWKDVIKEGVVDKAHNDIVKHGLRIGMALFILSEVMFFFAFFWSFFKAWLDPVMILEGVWAVKQGVFPPDGIHSFDPWDIPFINTLILLLSGTTVTWAHYALLQNNRKDLIRGLTLTVLLGLCFTCLQVFEYVHAPFGFKDGIYSSNFFMATGFHGAHVVIGTIFLAVCLFRAKRGQLTTEGHLGFEFAAWYWHFVDVVWLFLFTFVYVLSKG